MLTFSEFTRLNYENGLFRCKKEQFFCVIFWQRWQHETVYGRLWFRRIFTKNKRKKHFEPFQSFQKHLLHLQYFVGFSLFGFCIIHIQLSQNIRNRLECHSEDDSISIRWIMNYYDADCNACLRVCALCATILHAGMNN